MSALTKAYHDGSIHFKKSQDEQSEDGVLTVSKENLKKLKYPQWAPAWDPKDDHAFKNPEPFKHIDRGLFGDPEFKSLKEDKDVKWKRVTPKLGLEIDGIQLSTLTDKQKDDLALLVEQHGVVAFRNQNFKKQSFADIEKWGKYYGPLHVHPTSGAPRGQPNFHMTFRRGSRKENEEFFQDKLNNITWHSDVTYETQTPALTLFAMLQTGESGGDTQFLDLIEIYDRLSPLMKDLLDGLQAVHTSKEQAASAKSEGGIERKETIDSIHPVVRYHPVLKKKGLFVHREFTRKIVGLKTEESDALLLFLIRHIESCLDAHVRMSWDEDTVVVWDNRRVLHTRTLDWDSEETRHAFRLTTLGERPVGSEKEYNDWTPELEKENIKLTSYKLGLSAAEYYKEFVENKI